MVVGDSVKQPNEDTCGGGREMECKEEKQPENHTSSHRKQKLDEESQERIIIRMQKKQRKTHFDCKAEM